jgi:internalin A
MASKPFTTILACFTWLEVLDLAGNLLSKLPNGLANLARLRELNLADNPGLAPGEVLDQLENLRLLDLTANHLDYLPAELGLWLHEDAEIKLEGNFLSDTLQRAASHGDSRDILKVLRSRIYTVPNYEAKLLLVGEGNVGKTSPIEAMLHRPFIEKRETTHGIEIKKLLLPHTVPETMQEQFRTPYFDSEGETIQGFTNLEEITIALRSWDFGGQEIYRITHQFFFSPRSLYLVVWRPREGREENAVEDWIRRIRLRVGDDAKVIVVATHGAERRPEIDASTLYEHFAAVLSGVCTVDSKTTQGFDELGHLLGDAALGLPQIGEEVSIHWMGVRDKLQELHEPYIKRSIFDRICDRNDVPDDEADLLAKLLSDLGYVVYFPDDDGLRDTLILQPEWLTKAISYVLEDEETRNNGGILDHSRLEWLWSPHRGKFPSHVHPFLLRLMEKFDVSFRIPQYDKSLVGQLVPYARPDMGSGVDLPQVGLRLQCSFSEEPPGIIPWLIVRNHRFSIGKHWRHGVLLRHPDYGTDGLFELMDPTTLCLSVRGEASGFFFDILRDTLEHLCRVRWPGLKYSLSIPCPAAVPCSGRFPLRSLERLREERERSIRCLECLEIFDIHQLLTGFESYRATVAEITSGQFDEMRHDIAENLVAVRAIVKVLSAEVSDCPRLFTIIPEASQPFDPRKFWMMRYSLTLWCEESGAEHEIDDEPYSFSRPREWFTDIVPYLRIAAQTIGMISPVVAGISAVASGGETATKRAADLMKAVADAAAGSIPINDSDSDASGLARSEGAALRRFRELLLELDPSRHFAGLRRVLSPTGDYLWLCEHHYRTYEPTLPQLSYRTG